MCTFVRLRACVCMFPTVGCQTLRNLFTSMLLFLLSVTTDDGFGSLSFGKFHGKFCFQVGAQMVLIKVINVEPKYIFCIAVGLGQHCLCYVLCFAVES